MEFHPTKLAGAFAIDLEKRGDSRGFFARVFCTDQFQELGLTHNIVQVNNSLGVQQGTLRGMHYQMAPHAETKIVRCIRGALWDVMLDLRSDSPTFGQWHGEELTAENRRMLYVPKGFAHGFITLQQDTEIMYLVDEFYCPAAERTVRWDDPAFNIDWPMQPTLLSEKDAAAPDFQPAVTGATRA